MFNEQHKKESPILGMLGLGGGIARAGGGLGPFVASGGTKTGPEGGYYFHEYTPATPSPQKVFTVTSGIADITVVLQGGGGAGGSGSYSKGGAAGGGGATGVWTITGVTVDTHPITVGPALSHPNGTGEGDAGGYSQISHPSAGYARAGGGAGGQPANGPGAGGAGGTNSDPWSAATITTNLSGANGGNGGSYPNGTAGGNSGGHPQPVSNPQPAALWWRLRLTNPGYPHADPSVYPDIATYGGKGGSPGAPDGGSGGVGQFYGGGGAGGGNVVGAGGGTKGGMVVIRYPDAV